MCVSPYHRSFKSRKGKISIDCPCGHCPECLEQKKKDILFRAQYEDASSVFKFFLTLTYDATSLPVVVVREPVFDDNGELVSEPFYMSVWSKSDIQKFHKRLRIALARKFGISSDAFRYFLVCERGKKGTKRPHYHGVYFLRCAGVSAADFLKLCNECWNLGHAENMCIEEDRDEANALAYVTKYVTKQIDASTKNVCVLYHTNRYLRTEYTANVVDTYHHNCTFRCKKDFDTSEQLHNEIDPFVLMSKGFGISFLDSVAGVQKRPIYRAKKGNPSESRKIERYQVVLPDVVCDSLSKKRTINGGKGAFDMSVPRYYRKYLNDVVSPVPTCFHQDLELSSEIKFTPYGSNRTIKRKVKKAPTTLVHRPTYYLLQEKNKRAHYDKVCEQFADFIVNAPVFAKSFGLYLTPEDFLHIREVDADSFAQFYVYEKGISVDVPKTLESYPRMSEDMQNDPELVRVTHLSWLCSLFDAFNIEAHKRNIANRERKYKNNIGQASKQYRKRFEASHEML